MQESASMANGMMNGGGSGRGRSFSIQSHGLDKSARMIYERRMMERGGGSFEDWEMLVHENRFESDPENFFESRFESRFENRFERPKDAKEYFASFALIRIIGQTISGNVEEKKICAGVIMNPSSVLTSPSCFLVDQNRTSFVMNNTRIWVVTGIDRDTIGLAVNGNLSSKMNVTDVRLVTNHQVFKIIF